MATLYYQLPVTIQTNPSGEKHHFASASTSISLSPKLEENRNLSLAPNQHFKIGGNLDAKISLNFYAATSLFSGANYTATEQLLSVLTGDVTSVIQIGSTRFSGCYLENLSMEIVPFMPTMMTADFICLNANTSNGLAASSGVFLPPGDAIYYAELAALYGEDILVYLNGSPALPENGMYYGHHAVISGGSLLTNTRETISYKINCLRSPVYTLGSSDATNCFLDSVTKEISIKSDNVSQFIDYNGSVNNPKKQSLITVNLLTANQVPLVPAISFSQNARIVSQNLSINAGDTLAGQVTLREIVL
jgi:hypothetical protein